MRTIFYILKNILFLASLGSFFLAIGFIGWGINSGFAKGNVGAGFIGIGGVIGSLFAMWVLGNMALGIQQGMSEQ